MRARLRALLRRPRAFFFMSLLNKLARLHCMFIDLIKRQRCMINAVRYSKPVFRLEAGTKARLPADQLAGRGGVRS